MKKIIWAIVFSTILNITSSAQKDTTRNPVSFSLSLGILTGNDYSTALKQYFSGYTVGGYLGWLTIGLSIDLKLSNNFILVPEGKVLGGQVSITTPGFENAANENANFIFLTGMSAKYYLFTKKSTSVFIDAGINASFCSSGFDDFKYKSDGIEKEVFLGYEHTKGFRHTKTKIIRIGAIGLKIGYLSIPIQVNDNSGLWHKNDFGGIGLNIYALF